MAAFASIRHLSTTPLIRAAATTTTMPATIVKVPTVDRLHEVVNKAIEDNKGKDVFVYFYASVDPATGKSWCPHCVTADPVIHERFSKLDNVVFVDVAVGDRPTWKDPNHPLRHDKVIKIKSVPTLIHWNTLVEIDCGDLAKLDKFLERS